VNKSKEGAKIDYRGTRKTIDWKRWRISHRVAVLASKWVVNHLDPFAQAA